jgi:hypothetical protein
MSSQFRTITPRPIGGILYSITEQSLLPPFAIIKSNKITSILSFPDPQTKVSIGAEYITRNLMISGVCDKPSCLLLPVLRNICIFLAHTEKEDGGNARVLVHSPTSRTLPVTVALAYVMWRKVKWENCRSVVYEQVWGHTNVESGFLLPRPEDHFEEQLRLWGRLSCELSDRGLDRAPFKQEVLSFYRNLRKENGKRALAYPVHTNEKKTEIRPEKTEEDAEPNKNVNNTLNRNDTANENIQHAAPAPTELNASSVNTKVAETDADANSSTKICDGVNNAAINFHPRDQLDSAPINGQLPESQKVSAKVVVTPSGMKIPSQASEWEDWMGWINWDQCC